MSPTHLDIHGASSPDKSISDIPREGVVLPLVHGGGVDRHDINVGDEQCRKEGGVAPIPGDQVTQAALAGLLNVQLLPDEGERGAKMLIQKCELLGVQHVQRRIRGGHGLELQQAGKPEVRWPRRSSCMAVMTG